MSEEYVLIGAGLPRTGTSSMREALKQILEGKCYHMLTLINDDNKECEHAKFWDSAIKRRLPPQDWRNFFTKHSIRASLDYPASLFFKDLMRAYPQAKVVLSVRDSESWYVSVRDTIYRGHRMMEKWPVSWFSYLKLGKARQVIIDVSYVHPEGFDHSMDSAVYAGKDAAVKFYNDWVELVKRKVPKEKLLIHHVRDGWEPLCKFLDKPISSNPYPRINDSKAMRSQQRSYLISSLLYFIGFPILLSAFAMVYYYYCDY